MTAAIEKEFRALTVAERVELVGELWELLAAAPEEIPILEGHIRELQRRRQLYEADPNRAIPWTQAKAMILKRNAKRSRPA
jgi:putative addiction module component (TIGR02574 family)